jgi:hypothetical protein
MLMNEDLLSSAAGNSAGWCSLLDDSRMKGDCQTGALLDYEVLFFTISAAKDREL